MKKEASAAKKNLTEFTTALILAIVFLSFAIVSLGRSVIEGREPTSTPTITQPDNFSPFFIPKSTLTATATSTPTP